METNPSWYQLVLAVISTAAGAIVAVLIFTFRSATKLQQIDGKLEVLNAQSERFEDFESRMRDADRKCEMALNELRRYVDKQDHDDRHAIVGIMQGQVVKGETADQRLNARMDDWIKSLLDRQDGSSDKLNSRCGALEQDMKVMTDFKRRLEALERKP